MDCDRRTYLGLLATVAGAAAGCLGDAPAAADDGPADDQSPTATDTPTITAASTTQVGTDGSPERGTATDGTDTASPTMTPADGRITLQMVDVHDGPPLRVYPTDLREILRTAASDEGPVRAVGSTSVYVPEPVLTAVETVELVDPEGEAGGVYAVDCQGGTRYDLLVGAVEATPPEGATVTSVADLSGERRDLAVKSIRNEGPRVYPETELGEWVRTEFFDGYFAHEGTTYRGKEVQQTDAAFFSTEVWYVLELSPTADATDPVTLDLASVDPTVRDRLDPILDDRSREQETYRADLAEIPGPVRSFLVETDRILTHTAALAVDVA